MGFCFDRTKYVGLCFKWISASVLTLRFDIIYHLLTPVSITLIYCIHLKGDPLHYIGRRSPWFWLWTRRTHDHNLGAKISFNCTIQLLDVPRAFQCVPALEPITDCAVADHLCISSSGTSYWALRPVFSIRVWICWANRRSRKCGSRTCKRRNIFNPYAPSPVVSCSWAPNLS